MPPVDDRPLAGPRARARAVAPVAVALLLAGIVAVAPSARADDRGLVPPADPTLAALIDEALAARPELKVARATVDAERARVPQAGALPDPMLQVGWQNDGFTSIELGSMEGSYVSIMASQTFPWLGKRALRREVAALDVSRASQAVARWRLSTEAEVRRSYLALVLVRDRLALLGELEQVWQRSLGAARARLEAGTGAQSDLLRAQLELGRIKQRRIALALEDVVGVQALNRLRDHPLDEPIATATAVHELPALAGFADAFAVDDALARSPELAAARLGVRSATSSVALAKKGFYPDLEIGAGIMIRGSMPPMWLVTVGGAVPLFAGRKQRRAVDESRALDRVAQEQVRAIEQVLRLRTAERRASFLALVETIALYDQGLLTQSAATAESTLTQYAVGRVTFAAVLDANAGFIADREGYLQAVVAAHRLLIAEAEVSLEPTPGLGGGVGGAGMPGVGATSMGATPGAPATTAAPASAGASSGM